MAIGDYFRTITVLEQSGSSSQLGGRNGEWEEIATMLGVINQRFSIPKQYSDRNVKGKVSESSDYFGYFEYSSTNMSYFDTKYRFKDSDNRIYKIKGQPKNTMNKNHHIKANLTYESYLNG